MNADPARTFRNLSVYSALALLTLVGVYLLWTILLGAHVEILVSRDPALMNMVEGLRAKHGMSEATVREILKATAPKIDWFMLAMLASVLSFPVIGWLCGRFAPDPTWAGALPLLDLLSGMNPVLPRLEGEIPTLPLEAQVTILVLQVVLAHAAARWAARRRQ